MDGDDDEADGDGGVVGEVFDYSELQGLYDAHLQGTYCEHCHPHHAVVRDDDDDDIIDDDYDCTDYERIADNDDDDQ